MRRAGPDLCGKAYPTIAREAFLSWRGAPWVHRNREDEAFLFGLLLRAPRGVPLAWLQVLAPGR